MIRDLSGALEILDRMKEAELALAEFYSDCAQAPNGDPDFWKGISEDERRHAASLEHMRQALADRPERFEIDRPFSLSEVKAFIDKVHNRHDRIRRQRPQERQLLELVRELEQSLLESRCTEFLSTRDKEFNHWARMLAVETRQHRDRVLERMR
ncbi:hypothetical protein HS125_10925 [bacterium]|nr:hypothetical protein [bacterium]